MDQAKLFSGRAFVFQSPEEDSSIDKVLVDKIFQNLPEPIKIIRLELLYSAEDFDCYEAVSSDRFYNLKISFSDEALNLKKEANNLQLIKNQIAPKYISYGQIKVGETITYLITSQEQSHVVSDLGRNFLIENFSGFLFSWRKLLENKPPEYNLRDNTSDLFSRSDIKENFFEDAYEAVSMNIDLIKVNSLFDEIKQNLSGIYDSSLLESSYFCHGSLELENILYREGYFKVRNFNKSFSGHYFLDLSHLLLQLGVKGSQKNKLIKTYCDYMDFEFDQNKYKICEKVNILILLCELIINYFIEIYIFESSRPLKICKIAALYTQNFDQFCRFDFFSDYKSFLTKNITYPIIGS